MKPWMWFVILTIACWGAYVPTIDVGRTAIREGGAKNPGLWAFLVVGLAYFLVAVLVPAALLASKESLSPLPTGKGFSISLLAGAFGALGALGIILALMNGGKPNEVAPLVFAGAPIVATLIAMTFLHTGAVKTPDWRFLAGIVLAAVGAGLVLRFRPE